jgi:DNA-binding transcriptional MerR regulator
MTTEAHWTIDELAQLVGEALAVDYSGQSNGRVREVPDRRTIRWYTTIGLLDRPAAMRGRTALYDRRHLMQLVAVKRLQADGRSIAQVQEALLGADDRTLTSLARLPEPAAPESATPEPVAPEPVAPELAMREPAAPEPATARSADRAPARFWAAHPARPTPPRAALVPSLRLADGVTLVLDGAPRQLDAADLAAIADAATALLNVLHDRGLATPTDAAPTRGGQA